MGRDSSSSHIVVAFGVMIKLPEDPSWPIFAKRLEAFVASKKTPEKEDEGKSPTTKKPKSSLPAVSVLISESDTASMTKEEEKIKHVHYYNLEDYEYKYNILDKVDDAMEVILGKDHGLTMNFICAKSGYEYDGDSPIPPVLLLASKVSLEEKQYDPSAAGYDLELATISEEERDATGKKISLLLDQLGLETAGDDSKPGWKLAASNTLNPR